MANKEFQVRHGLSVNNTVLVANVITNNVGIGTASPSSSLHVIGNANITSNLLVTGVDIVSELNRSISTAQSAYNQANAAPDIANSYTVIVGMAGNTYTNTVGTAGNNYSREIGTASNTYTNTVGTAGNNYTNTVGAAGNNYTVTVGDAANSYTRTVGAASNAYTKLAYDTANTKFSSSGGTISGNVSIVGSLTVSGNVFSLDTETLVVSDPLIYLANNNYTSDIVDIGFIANYVNTTGSNVHTGLIRDYQTKEYYIFYGYDEEPDQNHVDTQGNNFTIAVLNADIRTSNLNLGGVNAINWIRSSYDQANTALTTGQSAFAQANLAPDIANSYTRTVGTAGNTYTNTVGAAGNNYARTVGDAGNTYTNTVGSAANNYTREVGTAGNTYTNTVGTAGNTFTVVAFNQANIALTTGQAAFARANIASDIANSYAVVVGAASNAYAQTVGTAGNNYTNTVGEAGNTFTVVAFTQANTALSTGQSAFARANIAPDIANSYTETVGTAGNNYTISVGTAGNNYTIEVGAAGNNYTVTVGDAANTYTNTVGAAGNAFTVLAFTQANLALAVAQTAFDQANTALSTGQAAFAQANIAPDIANSYTVVVGAASNTYTQTVGTAGNNYTDTVGAAGNAFTVLAFTQANTARDAANTANNLTVANNGVVVSSRNVLNFVQGANTILSVTDDSAGNRINVTITSLGSGGGGSTDISPAFNQANTAYDRANTAYDTAVDAFAKANSALQNTTGTFAGTLTATGDVKGQLLASLQSIGLEGGQLELATAQGANTSLVGTSVVIDIYGNKLRIFETGGTNRGAYIDLTTAATGVGSDLLSPGSTTDATARTWAASAFDKANSANVLAYNALPNTTGAVFNGNLTVSQNLSADRVFSTNNGLGENFKVGDDAWIGDTNLADTLRIKGQQNPSNGYIQFGTNDGILLGRTGTNALTYGTNTIWHAGNDGAGSGLDADLVDGQHGTYYSDLANTYAVIVGTAGNNYTRTVGDAGNTYARTVGTAGNTYTNTVGTAGNTFTVVAFGQANTALTTGQAAFGQANQAFGQSNTALQNTTGTFAGSLTITGDLITQGNVTLGDASTDTITINGSTISLGNNQSIDSGTLFIDAVNNRVGIGTTTPSQKLEVFDSTSTTLKINATSISTIATLGVYANSTGGIFRAYGRSFGVASLANKVGFGPDGAAGLIIFTNASSPSGGTGNLSIRGGGYDSAAEKLFIDKDGSVFTGNVGIGTTNPTSNLHVVGTANIGSTFIVQGSDIIQAIAAGNTYAQTVGTAGNNYTNTVGTAGNTFTVVAFGQANTALTTGQAAFGQANTARTHANAAFLQANAAYDTANTKFSSSGGTITGDVSIVGVLSITGNTIFANVSTLRIDDPLIYLANSNYVSDTVDIGFIANYVNATGSNVHTGLYREHQDKMYYLFQGYDREPINNHIGALSNNMTLAVLNADLRTSNLLLAGTNTVVWIRSSYDQANTALTTGQAAFARANIAPDIANSYTVTVGAASNTYTNTVGTAGNNYTNEVGTAGNNYTNIVGAASNTYAQNVGAAGNTYTAIAFDKANGAAQLAFSTVVANGNTITASTNASTFRLFAGTNMAITTEGSNITLTSTATGGTGDIGPAFIQANAAYDAANTKLANTSGVTFAGDLTITGNVGIGTAQTSNFRLEVNGAFAAQTKSFLIPHPTKEGMQLRYASLEGPENGVYVRGKSYSNTIELPDYWTGLVDEDTITVHLTPFGRQQNLYVWRVANNVVYVEGSDNLSYYYSVWAERKDVVKLIVEF